MRQGVVRNQKQKGARRRGGNVIDSKQYERPLATNPALRQTRMRKGFP